MRPSQFLAPIVLSLALIGCDVKAPSGGGAASAEEAIQQPPWDGALARQLAKAIEGRGAHGLDRIAFAIPGDADDEALTRVALAYASALATGASDPNRLFEIYTLPRPRPNLPRGLAQAMRDRDVDAWLESLAPQDEAYRKLSQAYVELTQPRREAELAIPDIATVIRPGQSDPRIAPVAARLVAFDYLEEGDAQGVVYSPAMVSAVRRLQADYGLKPDGVLGAQTLGVLSLTSEQRAREIAVNMERLRWLERDPPVTRIDVNIAAAQLAYWREGVLIDSRRVIVGEPDKATPQLGSPIRRLVANPTWTVPRSIQKREIAGKGEGYLRRHNMSWKDGWIVQGAGPSNSLGVVKFDMANEHAIYLHDTPAKQLFNEVQRHRSHGCVRVEDAEGFAELVAEQQGVASEWRRARAHGEDKGVALPEPIPVRLLYQTVLFNEGGKPVVRADPYNWNARVAKALGFNGESALRAKSGPVDTGP